MDNSARAAAKNRKRLTSKMALEVNVGPRQKNWAETGSGRLKAIQEDRKME